MGFRWSCCWSGQSAVIIFTIVSGIWAIGLLGGFGEVVYAASAESSGRAVPTKRPELDNYSIPYPERERMRNDYEREMRIYNEFENINSGVIAAGYSCVGSLVLLLISFILLFFGAQLKKLSCCENWQYFTLFLSIWFTGSAALLTLLGKLDAPSPWTYWVLVGVAFGFVLFQIYMFFLVKSFIWETERERDGAVVGVPVPSQQLRQEGQGQFVIQESVEDDYWDHHHY